jgi:3-hydroxymyristoyl/3-hydroxydecanoyl-(acyl carrier protein) dehydratase
VSPKGPEPVPHRFPFRLVERPETAGPEPVAIALATAGGAMTGTGPWPATLVTEALAQAILVAVGARRGGAVRLVGLDDVAVFRPLAPGDRLEVEVREVASFGALRRYHCRGLLAGGLAAVADVTVSG